MMDQASDARLTDELFRAAAWHAHVETCPICGNLEGEETCAEGKRLAFELTLAEEADDQLLPGMDVGDSN